MLYTKKINNNKTFNYLYKKGKCIVSRNIVIYVKKNKRPWNGLGISAGKKIGNAVMRNRAKRVIRQAYYECEKDMPIGMDMIIVARKNACFVKSTEITAYLKEKALDMIIKEVFGEEK